MKYSLATSTWDEKELKAIQSVIDKDMYTIGANVKSLKKTFQDI